MDDPVTERVITFTTDRRARDREEQLRKGLAIMADLDRKIAENPRDFPGPKPSVKRTTGDVPANASKQQPVSQPPKSHTEHDGARTQRSPKTK